MPEDLPSFRYHPDPVASGAIVPSDTHCLCCGEQRGFVYVGPVFSLRDDLDEALCPWCVADGSAAEKYDAEFVPVDGDVASLPEAVQEELGRRTVSFTGWQQVEWLVHCDDAMAFVAFADGDMLRRLPDACADLRQRFGGWNDAQFETFVASLATDASPTAYLFRCLHCGAHAAYADFD